MANSVAQSCLDSVLKSQAEIPVTIVTGFLGSGKTTLLIVFGDIILLNKTDLVTPEVVAELESYIRLIAPKARIITTEYGQVPLPLILDVGINNPLKSSKSSHEHSHHLENDGFVAVSFESDIPLILPKFQNFLDRLPSDIYRAKGILKFQGSQLRHVLQMSGKRYEMKSVGAELSIASRSPPPNANQLVFIRRNLNTEAIRAQLSECLAI